MINLEVLKAFIDSGMQDVVIIALISLIIDILVIVAIIGTWQNSKKMLNIMEEQYNALAQTMEMQRQELELLQGKAKTNNTYNNQRTM